jgi:hypothetical protein
LACSSSSSNIDAGGQSGQSGSSSNAIVTQGCTNMWQGKHCMQQQGCWKQQQRPPQLRCQQLQQELLSSSSSSSSN